MPVIRLTIMKLFTSVCFSVCSALVGHCDSWTGHFHPGLGLLSLPSGCVHACARLFHPHGQRARSQHRVHSSRKAGWTSHVQPGWGAGGSGSLLCVVQVPASQPHSAVRPTSGNHKILELSFVMLPAVFLAQRNTLNF